MVTKRIGEVVGLLTAEAIDGGDDQRVKLAQLRLTLKEKLEVLKQLDKEIVELLESEEDIVTEIDSSDQFNQRAYEALVSIDHWEVANKSKDSSPSRGGLEGGAATVESTTPSRSKMRLPKLVLKSFDGDITKWTSFWDSYKSAIHSDPDLSNVDKFTYLQGLLEKSARDSISGLALTADNYDQAVSILEKRFGNKQMIIHRHMDILLGIEGVSAASNLVALRKLYDKVESNVRSLEALGVGSDSYGSLLSPVLVKKLPNELRLMVSREISGDRELKSIMKILSGELEVRERSATPNVKDGGRRVDSIPTTTAFVSGNRPVGTGCCYCKGEHPPDTCNIVRSVKDRKQSLRAAGRCYVCLRVGHISRNCRSRARCHQCGGRHHNSICEGSSRVDSMGVATSNSPSGQNRAGSTGGLNPSAPPFGSGSTACCCVGSKYNVLLQTA